MHDTVKLEWYRSHLIYVVFLVVYLAAEFPAMRIGVAYESITRGDKTSPRRVVLATVQVLVALLVLPIYLSGSVVVSVWNILHWILLFPYHLWTEIQKEKGNKNQRREERTNTARSRGEAAGIEKAGHHAKCEKCEERDQGNVADC